MAKDILFVMNPAWKWVIEDLGVNHAEVLKRAELPPDLFTRKDSGLTTEGYFRFWEAMDFVFNDPVYPIKMIRSMSSEVFDPPIFASYCSPNLNVALKRLSQYKPLIGPLRLDVAQGAEATQITIHFTEKMRPAPESLIGAELAFFVQLARMATREVIVPLRLAAPCELPATEAYTDFFGVQPEQGNEVTITFAAADATKPFLTENAQMWDYFEPGLRKRLSEVSVEAGITERVRGALLEMLPSGQTSVDDLAKRLFVGRRTLQRRLGEEGTSFKALLTGVREKLARHYLTKSELPYPQISFLLGYDDPNSFFRAFRLWTGETPHNFRLQMRG